MKLNKNLPVQIIMLHSEIIQYQR